MTNPTLSATFTALFRPQASRSTSACCATTSCVGDGDNAARRARAAVCALARRASVVRARVPMARGAARLRRCVLCAASARARERPRCDRGGGGVAPSPLSLSLARSLVRAGVPQVHLALFLSVDVLAVDYAGYGASSGARGDFSSESILAAARAAWRYLVRRPPLPPRPP